jgi:hypothetical protein
MSTDSLLLIRITSSRRSTCVQGKTKEIVFKGKHNCLEALATCSKKTRADTNAQMARQNERKQEDALALRRRQKQKQTASSDERKQRGREITRADTTGKPR